MCRGILRRILSCFLMGLVLILQHEDSLGSNLAQNSLLVDILRLPADLSPHSRTGRLAMGLSGISRYSRTTRNRTPPRQSPLDPDSPRILTLRRIGSAGYSNMRQYILGSFHSRSRCHFNFGYLHPPASSPLREIA